jgi:DNA-binding LytR/AlgR family response regulator
MGDAIELVPVDDLVYLEAADKYVRAVTAGRDYWVRMSLRELLPQLDPERFWQVHRSTVVHIDAVARALRQENGTVLLELRQRPEKLTVSRVHATRFKPL